METFIAQSSIAFAAGMILNFMPCVLPVMPIKIQALLREIDGNARSRVLAAVALLAGSLTFFVVLGVLTASFGWMWGQLFQHSWFRLLLAAVFFGAAVATFTGWSWRLPQSIYRVRVSHHLGAFVTGALAGILSTPCSGPFLGSVLAFAATRSAPETIIIFSAIGCGLAFPYVTLLIWPGLLERLTFMSRLAVALKTVLGFVLLAGGLFFVQAMVSPFFRQVGWMALLVAVGVWLTFLLTTGSRVMLRPVLILVVAMTVVTGFRTLPFTNQEGGIAWQAYSDQLLEQAIGRPVLVAFAADWCMTCKALERTTFKDKNLLALIATMGVTALQVDLTRVDESRRSLLDQFGGRAIPYIVILDAQGRLVQRFTGIVRADTLMDSLTALRGAHAGDPGWQG